MRMIDGVDGNAQEAVNFADPSTAQALATKAYVDSHAGVIASFVFRQDIPASSWMINHNLHTFPQVSVVDSSNIQVYGDVSYGDSNTLTVDFTTAFSGVAYLL